MENELRFRKFDAEHDGGSDNYCAEGHDRRRTIDAARVDGRDMRWRNAFRAGRRGHARIA